ncbi:hypothetical protein CCYA_CCYA06G1957 [Cyanidiococcus yangmingshanensis]|nr:hypothetical protein CCYA_CCYA06G1957 [Cyanidiococcus yangmingshanensis]
MASYQVSTQRRYWKFSSPEELESLRQVSRSRYQQKYPQKNSIDPEREAVFRLGCSYRLYRLARAEPISLPRYVAATAVVLFKRFCLYNCILEWDLDILLCTLVYIAAKAEENYRAASQISLRLEREILSTEIPLLSSIHFQAVCYHPYLLIRAAFPEFQTWHRIDEAVIRTDAMLLMSPAAFALVLLGRDQGFHHPIWQDHEAERERCFELYEYMMQQTERFFEHGGSGTEPRGTSALEEEFERLRAWYLSNRDPLLDKDSAESRQRQEEEKRQLERQKRRHLRMVEEEERKRQALLSSGKVEK